MAGTRRTWASIGAAIVAVAACATPFVARAANHHGSSAPTSSTAAVPAGALTGDVDGDGTPDVVSVTRTGLLRVGLGSGRTIRHLLHEEPHLEGLADVGGGPSAIVTSRTGDSRRARNWAVWRVHGRRLTPLRFAHRVVIGSYPGSSVAWVSGRRLYDGTLDQLQHGADHVAVLARAWSLRGGRLTHEPAGAWCWDRSSGRAPDRCAPGQDWRYDVGSRRDLPPLLPTVHPTWASASHVSFAGETWQVRRASSAGAPENASYDLVHGRVGGTRTVRVPRGWAPRLFSSPVILGEDMTGVLVSQEGGDSDTWRVYADRGGRLQEVATRGPLSLGGGFTQGSGAVYYSWLTPHGRLFTRVGTGQPGHFRVYAWLFDEGPVATPPALEARDLGTVCIDELWQTYGTCRS